MNKIRIWIITAKENQRQTWGRRLGRQITWKIQESVRRKRKQKEKRKSSKKQETTIDKKTKAATEPVAICPGCEIVFEDPPEEDWIQYGSCKDGGMNPALIIWGVLMNAIFARTDKIPSIMRTL